MLRATAPDPSARADETPAGVCSPLPATILSPFRAVLRVLPSRGSSVQIQSHRAPDENFPEPY